jgi:hypothetical protein
VQARIRAHRLMTQQQAVRRSAGHYILEYCALLHTLDLQCTDAQIRVICRMETRETMRTTIPFLPSCSGCNCRFPHHGCDALLVRKQTDIMSAQLCPAIVMQPVPDLKTWHVDSCRKRASRSFHRLT